MISLLIISLISNFLTYIGSPYLLSYAQESNNSDFSEFRQREFTDKPLTPEINDPSLHIEEVATGLELPTTMAFLGPDDILVLEKKRAQFRE